MTDALAPRLAGILGLCKEGKIPGTVASFAALIFSFLTYYFLGREVYILFLLLSLALGFWTIRQVHQKIGLGDHQWIGIDEWAGMWLTNMFLFELNLDFKEAVTFSLLAFAVFRIIDITKFIPPLRAVNDNENQTALSVLLDDVIAGVYTYVVMLFLLGVYDLNALYASLLILLPGMVANMTPVFLHKIIRWDTPIHERLFGKNKTWRGFLGAIIIGTISYLILEKLNMVIYLYDNSARIIPTGFLFSFGAIGGDLVKSFFKRRIGVGPGEGWPPFDQIDYVLGMILLTYPLYRYPLDQIILMLVLGGAVSALSHRLGYALQINSIKQ